MHALIYIYIPRLYVEMTCIRVKVILVIEDKLAERSLHSGACSLNTEEVRRRTVVLMVVVMLVVVVVMVVVMLLYGVYSVYLKWGRV